MTGFEPAEVARPAVASGWGRLPGWARSVRFRFTLVYSGLFFALAALVLGGVYLALARSLDDQPISRDFNVRQLIQTPAGVVVSEQVVRAEIRTVEQLANERALDDLRTWSATGLALVFVGSVGAGWVVAGRVLAPIDRITAVARDISVTDLSRRIDLDGPDDELRRLAETFDEMLARLDGAFAAQRRFVQDASHELRNPLAVIRTNLDVVLADPNASADDLREAAVVACRATDRMGLLIEDLLAHAREQTVPDRRAPVEVDTAVVAPVVAEQTAAAEASGVRLDVDVAGDLVVDGDATALRRALANLVVNALGVAPGGTAVRVAAEREGDEVRIAVSDAGPGVPVEHRDAVFQRFWRGPDAVAGTGTGLGLAIVRQIAEGHGGRVEVDAPSAGGARFSLVLPAGRSAPGPDRRPGPAAPPTVSPT